MAKLLPKDQLRKRLDTSFSAAELKLVKSKAVEAGLPVAAFVRNAALGAKLISVPAGNAKNWSGLSRVASNLNQLAYAINCGQVRNIDVAIIEQLAEQVRLLRLDLTGGEETEARTA